jgi:hypothetical protein
MAAGGNASETASELERLRTFRSTIYDIVLDLALAELAAARHPGDAEPESWGQIRSTVAQLVHSRAASLRQRSLRRSVRSARLEQRLARAVDGVKLQNELMALTLVDVATTTESETARIVAEQWLIRLLPDLFGNDAWRQEQRRRQWRKDEVLRDEADHHVDRARDLLEGSPRPAVVAIAMTISEECRAAGRRCSAETVRRQLYRRHVV